MESATPKFRELWTVQLSTRKEFQLTGEEMAKVREAIQRGDSGLVEVKDGGFKLTHIVSWWLESRQIANQLAEGKKHYELTEEEREKGRAKVAEIREKFNLT